MFKKIALVLLASSLAFSCKDDKGRDTGEREGTDKWLGGKQPQPSDNPSPPGWMRDKPANAPAGQSKGEGTPVGHPNQVVEQTLRRASAKLDSVGSRKLEANAELKEIPDGVVIDVDVSGAPPGNKAVYIHEKGDCRNPKAGSMGPRFAPKDNPQAEPVAHLGDLGNVQIDSSGDGKLELKVAHASLKPGDPRSLLDRAIIIDAQEDKGASAPGSPTPLACGVIR